MHSQDALSAYLASEFRHAIGSYRRSTEELPDCRDLPQDPLADSLRALTSQLQRYNTTLASTRYAVGPTRLLRHPQPPQPWTVSGPAQRAHRWPTTQRDCLDYYATAIAALRHPAGTSSSAPRAAALGNVRGALLIGVEHDPRRRQALTTRFLKREEFLRERIVADEPVQPGIEQAARWWNADLQSDSGLAASVLGAAAEAHWLLLLVQNHRSGPVGDVMNQVAGGAGADDDRLLERAIALNTVVFAIAQAAPWIFAAGAAQRASAQLHSPLVRERLEPVEPLWIARRFILLALYRRAMTWRLLGDHRRSYNDYWKAQHIVRLSSGAPVGGQKLQLSILDALAEYRVSELYRADHDYRQALVHSCRSHDRMQSLMDNFSTRQAATRWIENSHWRVALLLSKGKAFYEQGQMKRACKWFLRAWVALDDVATTSGYPPVLDGFAREEIERVASWLSSVRHEPFVSKEAMDFELEATILALDQQPVPQELHALAADILDRLGHTLMVMRLSEDDRLARRCLELALELDRWNLLVRSDLLQLRSRHSRVALPAQLPPPLECWPSGGTVVDQVIRTAEHFTREQLDSAQRPSAPVDPERADQLVALALLDDFLTHTDSMHVRAGLLYQHIAPSATSVKPQRPQAAMEFVCLRRYGSTSPFMARPAAVPAIGGGYLLRLLSKDSTFNILIDPGDGIVANLYRVGFAITDLDMIVVTHDHPDHMAGLDPILALRKEHVPDAPQLQIYGNASVVQRYRGVRLETAVVAALPQPRQQPLLVPVRGAGTAELRSLDTKHRDLANNNALGFTLRLTDPHDERVGTLTFMSDAAPEAIGGDEWEAAFAADVVVAHISNASVQELRSLAFTDTNEDNGARAFGAARIALRDSPAVHARLAHEKLIHALDHSPAGENRHLLLQGLLSVARRFRDQPSATQQRVLVVGEFKEQLGPFRGKIARHVTGHVLGGAGHTALTADIGLRLRIAGSGVSVLCSTCALNNDRLQSERYHAADEIKEVCIKGNFEGMAWNCARHDPGSSHPKRFVERVAGYDVFGPAGQYHG